MSGPSEPSQIVDYDMTAPPARQVFSVLAFAVVGIPIVCVYLVMILIVPRFETIFVDFGTKLPAITQLLLDVARWTGRLGWIGVSLLPIAAGFLFPLFVQPDRARERSRVIIMLLLVIATLLFLLILLLIALVAPMISLMQNVSTGK